MFYGFDLYYEKNFLQNWHAVLLMFNINLLVALTVMILFK
jgi:hypothetical protein